MNAIQFFPSCKHKINKFFSQNTNPLYSNDDESLSDFINRIMSQKSSPSSIEPVVEQEKNVFDAHKNNHDNENDDYSSSNEEIFTAYKMKKKQNIARKNNNTNKKITK